MLKAIIFDCFGVLVGTGFWNVYRDAGGDPEKDAAYIDEWLRRANGGEITQHEFRQAMARKLGISVEEYLAAYDRDEVPHEALFTFIRDQLKPRYKIALLSNANTGVVERKIPADKLALFDIKIISAEVGLLKPDTAIYQLACERLGVEPEETIFTDDHEQYLPNAAAIGMQAILYEGFATFKARLQELGAV